MTAKTVSYSVEFMNVGKYCPAKICTHIPASAHLFGDLIAVRDDVNKLTVRTAYGDVYEVDNDDVIEILEVTFHGHEIGTSFKAVELFA